MIFEWINYQLEDAGLVDSWMDAKAVAMTGIDQGWDAYWNGAMRMGTFIIKTGILRMERSVDPCGLIPVTGTGNWGWYP